MDSEGKMKIKDRVFQFMIALDQLFGTVVGLFHRRGAWADETLSARAWREHLKSPGWNRVRKVVDAIFFWQKGHCELAFHAEREREHISVVYREVGLEGAAGEQK